MWCRNAIRPPSSVAACHSCCGVASGAVIDPSRRHEVTVAIDTREELVNALHVASEIEHGLMIQYLFPALSMKKRADEGLTAPQLAAARRWERTILGVAVEEMGHLGTVSNLLAA